jgi:hypothetical protein
MQAVDAVNDFITFTEPINIDVPPNSGVELIQYVSRSQWR